MSGEVEQKPARAQKVRNESRQRDLLFAYVAEVGAICVVMMWSVMNVVHNFWAIKGMNRDPAQVVKENWTVAIWMAVLLGVVPFCLSLYWLLYVVRKSKI